MKVWIILSDPMYEEHPNVDISGVYDSREKAEEAKNNLEADEGDLYLWIEEWDVK